MQEIQRLIQVNFTDVDLLNVTQCLKRFISYLFIYLKKKLNPKSHNIYVGESNLYLASLFLYYTETSEGLCSCYKQLVSCNTSDRNINSSMWELITQARNTKGSIRSRDILESTKRAFLHRHNRGIIKLKKGKNSQTIHFRILGKEKQWKVGNPHNWK